ncbi:MULTISPECIES: hypothetical protein, partial [Streptomyces]
LAAGHFTSMVASHGDVAKLGVVHRGKPVTVALNIGAGVIVGVIDDRDDFNGDSRLTGDFRRVFSRLQGVVDKTAFAVGIDANGDFRTLIVIA